MTAPAPRFDDAAPLEDRVAHLRAANSDLHGQELVRAVVTGEMKGRIALVSSFGAESAVLLDMVAAADPATPVVFLDTLKLFPETLGYRDALIGRLGLTDVRTVQPADRDLTRHDPDGTLWSIDPDFCCHIRKTDPLDAALSGFAGWITGRKRFHGGKRASLPTIEGDPLTDRLKINPLAPWTPDDIARYLADRDLPVHPLVDDGFLSIGCQPCTRRVSPGEDVRAGRWAWLDKTECGIHGEGI